MRINDLTQEQMQGDWNHGSVIFPFFRVRQDHVFHVDEDGKEEYWGKLTTLRNSAPSDWFRCDEHGKPLPDQSLPAPAVKGDDARRWELVKIFAVEFCRSCGAGNTVSGAKKIVEAADAVLAAMEQP